MVADKHQSPYLHSMPQAGAFTNFPQVRQALLIDANALNLQHAADTLAVQANYYIHPLPAAPPPFFPAVR
jgi:hypothetical protein